MIDRRINVRGIIFKDGKLLSQQLTPDHHGNERDYWCTPGGGLDDNESLQDGLIREMIEETGVEPKIGKLLFIQHFYDGEKEQLEFFFNIENPDDYETIDLAKTSHGLIEIRKTEFINPSDHEILPAFLQTINIADYVNNDRPVYLSTKLK